MIHIYIYYIYDIYRIWTVNEVNSSPPPQSCFFPSFWWVLSCHCLGQLVVWSKGGWWEGEGHRFAASRELPTLLSRPQLSRPPFAADPSASPHHTTHHQHNLPPLLPPSNHYLYSILIVDFYNSHIHIQYVLRFQLVILPNKFRWHK